MRSPAFWWQAPGIAAGLLRPVGAAYGTVAAARLSRPGESAGIPVICIGNPTLGGAGKTPAAAATAAMLAAAGERPAFLSRGYGGALAGPVVVDPESHDARDVGDEPLLLARAFPTVVAADRPAGARAARAAGASVVVMDDGFQNPALAKDGVILVVDARRGIGNGLVFPAGPLRAPLEPQLRRAQAIVVVGAGNGAASLTPIAARLHVPVFSARLEPDAAAAAMLRGRPALAFAGIGDPEKFFATLAAAGIEAPTRRSFPDHHRYGEAEAARLLEEARRSGLVPVTTEKDFVRLGGEGALGALRAATKVLPVRLEIDDADGYRALVLGCIRTSA